MLSLQPIGEHTIYFADHPKREVGFVPTGEFVAAVPLDPTDPPNAALVMELGGGDRAVAVLELSAPRYEAATQAFIYETVVLARGVGTPVRGSGDAGS